MLVTPPSPPYNRPMLQRPAGIRIHLLLLLTLTAVATPLVPAQVPRVEGTLRSIEADGRFTAAQVDRFASQLFAGYGGPGSRYAVDVYLAQVYTRYPNGRLTPVRVQIFVPRVGSTPEGTYLFMPGSTGLIGVCRASREHIAGIRWGLYRAHVMAMAAQGFLGILPDYMGFEDSRLVQPYFHAASEARVVFDALRAVNRWVSEAYPEQYPRGILPLRRVAAGFSQGGHAAFAAADRNLDMGGALYLHGVIGYGPTTEIEPMLEMYPSLGPMVAMSFLSVYGRRSFNPELLFQEPWAGDLEYDTTRQCVGGIQGFYPSDPSRLYRPDFLRSMRDRTLERTHPVIARIFDANRTGLAPHRVPALILQGTDDIVVARKTQERVVSEMRAVGNPVDLRVYEGYRHDTRQIGFRDAIDWMRSLDPRDRPPQRGGPERFDPELDQ